MLGYRDMTTTSTTPTTPTAPNRQTLAHVLRQEFADRNFATKYIAQRCKTTEATIDAWISGRIVPDEAAWGILCRMSRALPPYATLRQEALLEPCPTQEETAPEATSVANAAAESATIAWLRNSSPSSPSVVIIDRPGPEASTATSTEPTVDTVEVAASMTGTATAPARHAGRETQPSAFVTCQCKISRGQVAQLTVPVRFTTEDAEKIAAFLLSWIDDPEER